MSNNSMSNQELQHLVKMVNQITLNINAENEAQKAEKVADHMRRFWAKSMREKIVQYLQNGGADLSPISCEAINLLH